MNIPIKLCARSKPSLAIFKAVTVVATMAAAGPALAACPPEGWSSSSLRELRSAGFAVESPSERDALALALVDCTDHPDPDLRDGVAFEGLATWLRAEAVGDDTVASMAQALLAQLDGPADAAGFRKPFAALMLSEVARTDRIEPRFPSSLLERMVNAAASYLASVEDFRGFSDTEGWRHGVAHGSDLVLQLILNERIDASQTSVMLQAIQSRVAPPGEVFYVYGEPGRLARPVIFAWKRGLLDAAWWAAWFDTLSDPAPMGDWSQSWSSNAGMARRHDLQAFLSAIVVSASASPDDSLTGLADLTLEAMRAMR